jgi:hypothetical protein
MPNHEQYNRCDNHEERIVKLENTVYNSENPANSIAIRLDRIEQKMLIGLWVISAAGLAFIGESIALVFVVVKHYMGM